jgi:hypothetical protein
MEHRCPFALNPLSNPMIQLLWTIQNSESVGSILFYKVHSDLRRVTWESLTDGSPMWWGPRAVRASQRQVRVGKSGPLALDINDTHAACLGIFGRARTERALDINGRLGRALGISGPLYRYTSVHRENTLTKSYIRMVLARTLTYIGGTNSTWI